jgi:hypothetical protein
MGEVSTELGAGGARVGCDGDRRAVARLEPAFELIGEEQVGELGLAVGASRSIAGFTLEVIEVDPTHAVGGARHRHDPGPGCRQHEIEQESGQREVTEMVGAELKLETVDCQTKGWHHHARVVHEQVNTALRRSDRLGSLPYRRKVREVETHDRDVRPGTCCAIRPAASVAFSWLRQANTAVAPRSASRRAAS